MTQRSSNSYLRPFCLLIRQKPDDECALLGELGDGGRGEEREGEVHPEPTPSTLCFQGMKKKGSLLSRLITRAGETGQAGRASEGEVLQAMGFLWHSKD